MARLESKAIPALLVNARLSDRSTAGYRRIACITGPLIKTFECICVQSQEDADRFITLGADPNRVRVTGNLKFDQPIRPLNGGEVARLRRAFHLQPEDQVIVAGSTHPGEEQILIEGIARLKENRPGLKLVIAPRDPERAAEVKVLSSTFGLKAVCLADIEKKAAIKAVDVVVIDRIGILGDAYALGDFAFVGGSLVNAGGHNPLEAAALKKPVIFGADMRDFRQIARWLVTGGAAAVVDDADGFVRQAQRLLENPEAAELAGKNAYRVFTAHSGAVGRTLDRVVDITGWTDA
jgi:3-deoxy-D-manno-octulosonic-acid transferase